MCGFAGVFGRIDLPETSLRAMGNALAHRGPDEERHQVLPGEFALVFRRLSIIDLETGSQPLSNEDCTVIVVCNGEIYNAPELRSALEASGHVFRTNSDCEVVPHLYERYGVDFAEHLQGMFAIAIWDDRRKVGLLVRDRLGVKPVYFASVNGGLLFGSEPRSLLASGLIDGEPDLKAIVEYLTLQYIPAPRSGFTHIQKLGPGELLTFSRGSTTIRRYWTLAESVPAEQEADFETGLRRLDSLLLDATRRRLVSDVPVGIFLSGGIDSSLIASYVAEIGENLETFSVGFEDSRYDESEAARRFASSLGVKHTSITLTPEYVPRIADLIPLIGEPFADSSVIPTHAVSELARRTVTVALAGDGGDEAFGGYDRYRRLELQKAYELRGLTSLGAKAGALLTRGDAFTASTRRLALMSLSERDRFATLVSHFTPRQLRMLLSDELCALMHVSTWDAILDVPRRGTTQRFLDLDSITYLPGAILTKVDRASMAVGLEVRAPFMDFRVHELAATFPSSWKVSRRQTKPLLRALGERRGLPQELVHRTKRGFSMPLGAWLRGPLREWAQGILLDPSTLARGYFRSQTVHRLVDLHMSARSDQTARLWNLLILELWHRELIDSDPARSLPELTSSAA